MTFLYEAFPCGAFQIDGHQIFYDFGVLSHDFFLYHVHDYEFWKGIGLNNDFFIDFSVGSD